MNNDLRTEKQNEAIATLERDKRLILEWGTGVGKTRVAVHAINNLLQKNPKARILLAVQERAHKDNWKKEFMDVLGEMRGILVYDTITIDCYASLKNHEGTYWNLFIADEGHHLRGDNKIMLLETIYADSMLFLSATINDKGDGKKMLDMLDSHFGKFTTLSYGINDAIEEGILAEPEIHVLKVNMNQTQRTKYTKLTDYMEAKKKEYYDIRRNFGMRYDEPDNLDTTPYSQRFMQAARIRKSYTGAMKTAYAAALIKNLDKEGKKYICFCSDVKQIEKLGGKDYICSKKTPKENDAIIRAFNEGAINRLFAVGMIREGQNLRGIEAGVIIQLDGKERSFKQMFGRVMRSENPILYLLYVPDAQDEKYLENALKDTEQRFIKGWTKPTLEMKEEKVINKNIALDKDISTTTLLCGVYNPSIYYNYNIGVLEANKGILEGTVDGREVWCNKVGGTIRDVLFDATNQKMILVLQDSSHILLLRQHWNMSLGMLLPLTTLIGAIGKGILLTTSEKNGFTNFTFYYNNVQLYWPKVTIPKEKGERINLLNNIIQTLTQKQSA